MTGVSTPTDSSPRRGFPHNATVAWVVAGLLALAVIGLAAALATNGTPASSAGTTPPTTVPTRGGGGPFGGGAARPGFAGGVFGTVKTVGSGTFTVTTRAGSTVTVDEQSSTVYTEGATSAASSAVVVGARVAVQGSDSGTTVKATRVIILPAGGFGFGGGGGFGGAGAGTGSTG